MDSPKKYKHKPARILESVPIFVIFVGLYYYTVIMEYPQCHRVSITGVFCLQRYLPRCQILSPVFRTQHYISLYIYIYTNVYMSSGCFAQAPLYIGTYVVASIHVPL